MVNKLIDILSDSDSILILGYGREGRSTYRLIKKYLPNMTIGVADMNTDIANDEVLKADNYCSVFIGDDYQKSINNYDFIVKSPGVKIADSEVKGYLSSQTDIFFAAFSNQIIGVTGTKGKSTTASMIYHILKKAGKSVHLIGNIGTPAFEIAEVITDDDIIVYELSAHQLEYVSHSPHIAVLLNIFPEHLDYFKDYNAYKQAKLNLCAFSKSEDWVIAHNDLRSIIKDNEAKVQYIDNSLQKRTNGLPVVGNHNRVNAEFAIKAVSFFDVKSEEAIQCLMSFKPLPHRLEYLGNYGGVDFINDSISTIPQSTIAAINSLSKVDILILGGFDRRLDYKELVDFIETKEINTIILLGKAGKRIYDNLDKENSSILLINSFEDIGHILLEKARLGDVCLLSPAAASYDQFKNFEHRGDKFREIVTAFSKFDGN